MHARTRILVIFGTRPEAIKLFPVVAALRADPRFEARVCVSGQHRDMLDQVLSAAGVMVDYDLDLMRPDQSLDTLTASLLTGLGEVIGAEKPARVLVQGDTATALCGALAAYHRRIPVDHVEAGLRSGDLYRPWPEEGNRRMIGTLASLHFAPTESAAAALRGENIAAERIHVTGNTVIDALYGITARIAAEPGLVAGLAEIEAQCAGKRIIGVTCHRRESFGEGLERIAEGLRTIATRTDVALIFPLHRNPRVRAVMERELGGLANITLTEPLDYPHFVRLLGLAEIVLSDSGGIQEEAPALGKPVLVLRDTTERPEGVAAGAARLVGTDASRIVTETFALLDDASARQAMSVAGLGLYGDGAAADRIVECLAAETRTQNEAPGFSAVGLRGAKVPG